MQREVERVVQKGSGREFDVMGPVGPDSLLTIARWCGGQAKTSGRIIIPTPNGDDEALCGDRVVRRGDNDFVVYTPLRFLTEFEPVGAQA